MYIKTVQAKVITLCIFFWGKGECKWPLVNTHWLVDNFVCFLFVFFFQSLLLLHYLINNGSERVVTNAREHIYDMKPLEEFACRDENGKDQGINGNMWCLCLHVHVYVHVSVLCTRTYTYCTFVHEGRASPLSRKHFKWIQWQCRILATSVIWKQEQ